MSWTVYTACSLCAGKSPMFRGENADKLSTQSEDWCRQHGWLEIPERTSPRRFNGWLCLACKADVGELIDRECQP